MRKLLLICTLFMFLSLPCLADEDAIKGDGHELLGVIVHPYSKLTLTRVGEMSMPAFDDKMGTNRWSTGFCFGAEMDAGGLFLDMNFKLHDILAEDTEQAFPWDSSFELGVGAYF